MKANMAALKKEPKGFAEKEKAWQKKVHELTQRHDVEVGQLKQQVETSLKEKEELEASLTQLAKNNKWPIAKDNKWLIEHSFQQIITYLLHSSEFNSALNDPGEFEVFKDTVVKMELLTYPSVGEVSEGYGKPLSVLQGLKPRGLNEVVCNEVLKSLSKKSPYSRDSEDTCSVGGDGSKGVQALK
ncbi:hypothetical protein Hanom_Chr11g01011471 [Helianthus anomalus]